MKVLFLSLHEISSINDHGLYSDLLREFAKHNHEITIISPVEKRTGHNEGVFSEENVRIIKVRIGNIQKTNYIEKLISTLFLNGQLVRAIKKECTNETFDLLLYATPPITIYGLVKIMKRLTKAKTFLMLKDIWPQEMVDLSLIKKNGIAHRYFLYLEKNIYNVSDWIGFTSPANKDYLIKQGINKEKLVEVNNSVDPSYKKQGEISKYTARLEFGINEDKILFFYGGNLGRPQDIDFLIDCLKSQLDKKDRFYVVCGSGTEYWKLEKFFKENRPFNMRLFPNLSKYDYDKCVISSDVGMVFLNYRFTVPNCPSRFYTYMEYNKPVLACTDKATDIRIDIEKGNFGWWCESKDVQDFMKLTDTICSEGRKSLEMKGNRARDYLDLKYTVDKDYERIVKCLEG